VPVPAKAWQTAAETVWQNWRLQSGSGAWRRASPSSPFPFHQQHVWLRVVAGATVGKPEHQRAAPAAEGDLVAGDRLIGKNRKRGSSRNVAIA